MRREVSLHIFDLYRQVLRLSMRPKVALRQVWQVSGTEWAQ